MFEIFPGLSGIQLYMATFLTIMSNVKQKAQYSWILHSELF